MTSLSRASAAPVVLFCLISCSIEDREVTDETAQVSQETTSACATPVRRRPVYGNRSVSWTAREGTASYSVVIKDRTKKTVWGPYYHYRTSISLSGVGLFAGQDYYVGVAAPSEPYEWVKFRYGQPAEARGLEPVYVANQKTVSWNALPGVSSYRAQIKDQAGTTIWGPFYHYRTTLEINRILPKMKDGEYTILLAAPGDPEDALPFVYETNPSCPENAVDVLFVIDNSGDMEKLQSRAIAAVPSLLGALRSVPDMPSVHVGVISTDLGAGSHDTIYTCQRPGGDRGVLQVPSTCWQLNSARFLFDRPNGAGGRLTNYPAGQMSETVQCMASLGVRGCGFEQPLEAIRRALDPATTENAGFLRPNAALAIILVTSEDDCSASDPDTLFDPSEAAVPARGPLIPYRCFESGVRCNPDDYRMPGAKEQCVSREDSPFSHPLSRYETLSSLKPAGRFLFASVSGASGPVNVFSDLHGMLSLESLCSSHYAFPAVRLHQLLSRFGAAGRFINHCDGSFEGSFAALGADISGMARNR